jgi:hypothetical protein
MSPSNKIVAYLCICQICAWHATFPKRENAEIICSLGNLTSMLASDCLALREAFTHIHVLWTTPLQLLLMIPIMAVTFGMWWMWFGEETRAVANLRSSTYDRVLFHAALHS